MALQPTTGDVVMTGLLSFEATALGKPTLQDSFELVITIPSRFPRALPLVTETGGKIPRDGHHHVNGDGTLCLGSPLRLLLTLSKQPDLLGFAERCIVPFVYAISHKIKYGGPFIFDELAHGNAGVLTDYRDLFHLRGDQEVKLAWLLLSLKPRLANKRRCPCGCGQRLGRCSFRFRLKFFRKLAPRKWFRKNQL